MVSISHADIMNQHCPTSTATTHTQKYAAVLAIGVKVVYRNLYWPVGRRGAQPVGANHRPLFRADVIVMEKWLHVQPMAF